MKSYDNSGKLRSEINTIFTQDGRIVNTNTIYGSSGQPVTQTISVRDKQGKVATETTIGGRLLP